MKTSQLLFTALLGLGISSAACAQTTPGVLATPGVPGVPGTPSGVNTVPGQPATMGTVPSSTLPTNPAGTATGPGTIYSPGAATPMGTPGVLPAGQPVSASPHTAPVRGTRRANSSTKTAPVRP